MGLFPSLLFSLFNDDLGQHESKAVLVASLGTLQRLTADGCFSEYFILTESFLPALAVFPAQAQAVTLTVAQAFKVALDLWEIAQEGEDIE